MNDADEQPEGGVRLDDAITTPKEAAAEFTPLAIANDVTGPQAKADPLRSSAFVFGARQLVVFESLLREARNNNDDAGSSLPPHTKQNVADMSASHPMP
jgi:hypothetical protein